MVYFHANAEDIGQAYPLLDCIRTNTRFDVLAPEFPGYGSYRKTVSKDNSKNITCSSAQLKEDCECIYDFILANFSNVTENDIILYGRSMGSGPVV